MLKVDQRLISRNQNFLLDREHLIDFAKARGITLSNKLLDSYEEYDLCRPILTESDTKYYDQFQIYELVLLHVSIQGFISGIIRSDTPLNEFTLVSLIETLRNNDWLKQRREEFLILLPLLLEVRYFYLPEVLGFVTLKVYDFESQGNKFKPQSYEEWEMDKVNFNANYLLSQLKILPTAIDSFRTNVVSLAHHLDPVKDWYTFLRQLKKSSTQTFKSVQRDLRLAHDLYEMAEILTLFLEKSTGKPWSSLDEIFDLRGGAWRRNSCQSCSKEFSSKTVNDRFCDACKKEIMVTTKGAWRCKKCDTVLQKYLDGNEIFNESFPSVKGKENKLPISIRVEYGLVTLAAQCPKCKTTNYRQISSGWI